MPLHNWSRVKAGIFHDFHHEWISQIKRSLNSGGLPPDYYAMAEQYSGDRELDVLTLQSRDSGGFGTVSLGAAIGVLPRPVVVDTVKTEEDWYRRKKSHVTVRHVSDDRVVALIEIVSGGNKSNKKAFEEFVAKALEQLSADVHLLLIDVLPRTKRDPNGIHPAIWENITDEPANTAGTGNRSAVAYEVIPGGVNAYCHSFSIGDRIPDMPLFLAEDAQVPVSLEVTYGHAFEAVPKRWRTVIEE
ncbi:MAG TPA: DUF4058 family protein [Gemmataceae bacterium]|jgi:hypothetical protein|nr:DUF4058 family protein [Gemmataceae bacterium]